MVNILNYSYERLAFGNPKLFQKDICKCVVTYLKLSTLYEIKKVGCMKETPTFIQKHPPSIYKTPPLQPKSPTFEKVFRNQYQLVVNQKSFHNNDFTKSTHHVE